MKKDFVICGCGDDGLCVLRCIVIEESWLGTKRRLSFFLCFVSWVPSEHWYLYGRSAIFSLVHTCPFRVSEGRKELVKVCQCCRCVEGQWKVFFTHSECPLVNVAI